jgi:hypothetical protein
MGQMKQTVLTLKPCANKTPQRELDSVTTNGQRFVAKNVNASIVSHQVVRHTCRELPAARVPGREAWDLEEIGLRVGRTPCSGYGRLET